MERPDNVNLLSDEALKEKLEGLKEDKMYHTILVPLDGSKRAEAILPHLEQLARRYEAKVIFLQVIELAPLVRAVRERQSQAPALQAGGEAEDFVRDFLRRHTPEATAQLVQGLIGWLTAQRLLPPP